MSRFILSLCARILSRSGMIGAIPMPRVARSYCAKVLGRKGYRKMQETKARNDMIAWVDANIYARTPGFNVSFGEKVRVDIAVGTGNIDKRTQRYLDRIYRAQMQRRKMESGKGFGGKVAPLTRVA